MTTTSQPLVSPKAVAFFDGQNLYHSAKELFGRNDPDYDVIKLAQLVCTHRNWTLHQTRFYTGIPERQDKPDWNDYWSRKIRSMSRNGVYTFTRNIRKRTKSVQLRDSSMHTWDVFEEKGIDVRIALDLIRGANKKEYDAAIIFSQDQDLSEAVKEVREIVAEQGRTVELVSAFPGSPQARNHKGIDGTTWFRVFLNDYLTCLDGFDYWAAIQSANHRGRP